MGPTDPVQERPGPKVETDWMLVGNADSIFKATNFYQNPSPWNDEIGPRLPKALLPLSYNNESSLLIDLRPDTFGNILYHPDLSVWTFGTPMNDWHTIGLCRTDIYRYVERGKY